MEFSDKIKEFLDKEFPNKNIYNMLLDELKSFKQDIENKREEYMMLEMAFKVLGNGAYGASASPFMYFYNVELAGDITGECRNLTKTMWNNLENFFHTTIWERKDLWEKFNFALDENKRQWYENQSISVYSDTDSVYTTYGTFFQCMTPEYQEKYKTSKAKLDWILNFNLNFLDGQNTKWCEEIYEPRFGKSVHAFELETVSYASIYLKKKKYLKGLVYSKGKYFDEPHISGTGIELIKSTTPKLCKEILEDLTKSLLLDFDDSDANLKEQYILFFNERLEEWRRKFFNAPLEEISQSVGIGDYKKFVIDDETNLVLGKGCPVSVHSIARYNYLANKNGEADKKAYSGKIKYYNIRLSRKKDDIGYFGYPAGELPSWAPPMDKQTQWYKTIIKPMNAFLEVMGIPTADAVGSAQLSLF